jgi:hypothetical protein
MGHNFKADLDRLDALEKENEWLRRELAQCPAKYHYANGERKSCPIEHVDFDVGEPTSYVWNPLGWPYNHTINVLAAEGHGVCEFVGDPWACAYNEESDWCPIAECEGGNRCYTKCRTLMEQAFHGQ